MATQRDRADADQNRVLSAFVDAAPRTVTDVALATGVDVDDAKAVLSDLCAAGSLNSRSVSGVDISARKAAEAADVAIDEPITLYYRPADALAAEDMTPPTADDEIGRRLERMSIPGASDLMRSWRRDAVRATYNHVVESGGTTMDELVTEVYSGHEAGFDDSDAWWAFIRPRLYRLPGIAVDDEEWYVEQRPAPRRR